MTPPRLLLPFAITAITGLFLGCVKQPVATTYPKTADYNVVSNTDIYLYESQIDIPSNTTVEKIPAYQPFKVLYYEPRPWNWAVYKDKKGWIRNTLYVGYSNGQAIPIRIPEYMTKYAKAPAPVNWSNGSSQGGYHNIITGPRGGHYYINSNGNKTYIKKH